MRAPSVRPFAAFAAALLAAFTGLSSRAATFVVPPDDELIRQADAVVIATALESHAQLNSGGSVETVTLLSVEEKITDTTGTIGDHLSIYEPGGRTQSVSTIIPGVPHFEPGERVLLLLRHPGHERWVVSELVLGKFRFETDDEGRRLLVRDAGEIRGWDPKLSPWVERRRLADDFLRYVRSEARHESATASSYFVSDSSPYRAAPTSRDYRAITTIAPFTANSYTMVISGSAGSRWTTFPSAVNFYMGATQEPGAPGGGTTAITTAFASWNNDCLSNVNYVFAGADPTGTHTQGLHGSDGLNTILFERDLSAWGVAPFTCSANGYSGTLGLGGITVASGTNTVNGETFATTVEADVEMNKGLANCSLLFSNGDFNSAVTHEVGHTLGFRHSDQNRSSDAACSTDTSLECSNTAIMKSFVTTGLNGALQAWDQHAVQAVYPGNVCAPTSACTAPSINAQPASVTVPAGTGVTLSVGAGGTSPGYQWFTGPSGVATNPISGATGPTLNVTPPATTSYWVRVSNSCGSVNSTTATVTVTPIVASSFYLIPPCRILDTRGGAPIPASGSMNLVVVGKCGIPSGVLSLAVNITAVSPGTSGFVTLYPGPGSTVRPDASTLNYTAGRTLANNARILVGSDGSINIFNAASLPLDFLIDLSGYFK